MQYVTIAKTELRCRSLDEPTPKHIQLEQKKKKCFERKLCKNMKVMSGRWKEKVSKQLIEIGRASCERV